MNNIMNEITIIINLKMKNLYNLINKSSSDMKVMIKKNKEKMRKIS